MPVPRKPEGLGSMFEADNGLRILRDGDKNYFNTSRAFWS